jgi:hypothetical protein
MSLLQIWAYLSCYFRLFKVSWCQLFGWNKLEWFRMIWSDLEWFWQVLTNLDSNGMQWTSLTSGWLLSSEWKHYCYILLLQFFMQDLEYFRCSFVNRKLDNELKTTSNPLFGWRAWSIWNYRKAFKVHSKSFWSRFSSFFNVCSLCGCRTWMLLWHPVHFMQKHAATFHYCISMRVS